MSVDDADRRRWGTDLFDRQIALSLRGVSKSFHGVPVLRDVNLRVRRGTVHGLVGVNGAGKSTLVKILSGYHTPDGDPSCQAWGKPLKFPVRDPRRFGIAVVQQDLALADNLTVLENVSIGGGLAVGATGRRRAAERRAFERLVGEIDIDLAPHRLVSDLSGSEKALVAIVRALSIARTASAGGCLLVLDEPTAFLGHVESAKLLDTVRRIVEQGNAAILVSHRLGDIASVCPDVTVLRGGRVVEQSVGSVVDKAELARHMLGHEMPVEVSSSDSGPRQVLPDTPVLEVNRLTTKSLDAISFQLPAGRVLGFVGLIGSGAEDLAYAIMGSIPRLGTVTVAGRQVRASPVAARKSGMGLVPGDRIRRGLWARGTVSENLWPAGRGSPWLLSPRRERRASRTAISTLQIVPADAGLEVARLSGGNQQKIVLGRLLSRSDLRVLLLHEPTAGVDVGARANILELVREHARTGTAVLICSSDIQEIIAVADEISVITKGVVSHRLPTDRVNEEELARLMHTER